MRMFRIKQPEAVDAIMEHAELLKEKERGHRQAFFNDRETC